MKKIFFSIIAFCYTTSFSQQEILKINVEKVFSGKLIGGEFEINHRHKNNENYNQVLTIEKKDDFYIFKNSMLAKGTYSTGMIHDLMFVDDDSDEFSTKFIWTYSNSYDDKKGFVSVDITMVKNKIPDKNKIFVAVMFLDVNDNVTQYEGYINSSEFIKITEK